MNKPWKISARHIAVGLIGWLIATNIFVGLVYATNWLPFKLLLFICITFLPGVALLRVMRIVWRSFSAGVVYSFGLSILVLMLSGLAANQVLHAFGVDTPLGLSGALCAWNVVTALIIAAGIDTNSQAIRLAKWKISEFSKPAWLLTGLSLLLPCIAALGAFRLNNGGDALFSLVALAYATGLIVYAFLLRQRLPNGLLAWLIFVIGFTILLMTSLRGWDIVGHDIEREFRVYTLTHIYGRWDINLDRDPYNACLSITILPEMFARLLNVSGLVVFKVILQIVFAVCPAVVFLLLRQYTPPLGALAGSMLFICYPTFINDSAMLTRQGVAYLFFALALLVVANKMRLRRYKLLFLLCAVGAVLSHYSTAYMFVALFIVAVVCKVGITWRHRRQGQPSHWRHTAVSPLFAGILFFMTFIWYSQVTATSSGLVTTLHTSLANIPKLFSDDNKSSDTSTALLFAGGKSQLDLYQSYITKPVALHSGPTNTLAPEYMPTLTSDDLPLTWLGHKARSIGIEATFLNTLRQNFAKILQLLALAGVVYAAYILLRKEAPTLQPDFVYLSIAGIVLLALMVILPVLSINYGILRAFQQSLIFLLLPIMLLLVKIGRSFVRRAHTAITTGGIVLLFFVFSGMCGQLLGGVSPPLSMNNSGLYYGLYYAPQADWQAFTWLKTAIPSNSDVRAANFNKARMHDPDYPFTHMDILPAQISPHSYVYLDQTQVVAQRFYTYYQSSPLTMTFPLSYYDATKNQIYSTTTTRIYK